MYSSIKYHLFLLILYRRGCKSDSCAGNSAIMSSLYAISCDSQKSQESQEKQNPYQLLQHLRNIRGTIMYHHRTPSSACSMPKTHPIVESSSKRNQIWVLHHKSQKKSWILLPWPRTRVSWPYKARFTHSINEEFVVYCLMICRIPQSKVISIALNFFFTIGTIVKDSPM